MPDLFRLPCPHCSTANPVELRQAGESVACLQCGQAIEVPTLRGLRQLAPVEESTSRRKQHAEPGQFLFSRILFVAGLVACFLGVVVGGGFWYSASRLETEPPQAEVSEVQAQISKVIDESSLTEFWTTWHEQIISRPPGQFRESYWAINRRIARSRMMIAYGFLALLPLGIAAMVASKVVERREFGNSRETRV